MIALAALLAGCGGGDIFGEWRVSVTDDRVDDTDCEWPLEEEVLVSISVEPSSGGRTVFVRAESGPEWISGLGCFGVYQNVGVGNAAVCNDTVNENDGSPATITLGNETSMTPRLVLDLDDDRAAFAFYTAIGCTYEGDANVLDRVRD